jgi:hypothetical protein
VAIVVDTLHVLFRPATLQFPFVSFDKTSLNVSCSCVEEIALATAATEEYDVFGYVTIELATTLPCVK